MWKSVQMEGLVPHAKNIDEFICEIEHERAQGPDFSFYVQTMKEDWNASFVGRLLLFVCHQQLTHGSQLECLMRFIDPLQCARLSAPQVSGRRPRNPNF